MIRLFVSPESSLYFIFLAPNINILKNKNLNVIFFTSYPMDFTFKLMSMISQMSHRYIFSDWNEKNVCSKEKKICI